MTKFTATISEVTNADGDFMGFEFEIGGQIYFYAANQFLWEGLRAGAFPCDADGKKFPHTEIHRVTRERS